MRLIQISSIVLILYFIFDKYVTNNVEINSKHEWSLLIDSVENGKKPNFIDGIGFVKTAKEDLDVIVISTKYDGDIYILANVKNYPTLKIFPEGKQLNITQKQYELINRNVRMSQDVKSLLKSTIE